MSGKLLPLRRQSGAATSLSDEALLLSCAAGDTAALSALFDRYEAQVRRFVARLAGSDGDSLSDLLQTTFLEVYRSAGKFARRSSVKTWIFGIAANTARHHVRGEMRRRALVSVYAEQPTAASASPHDAVERRQMLARLEAALSALRPELREAFVLCDLEEIPGAEAARALGLREGTLWWRLSEARRILRAAVGIGP